MPNGVIRVLLGALLMAASLGCDEPPANQENVGREVVEPPPREIDDSHRIYDDSGIPLESDVVIAGLPMPRGLTEVEELRRDRRRTFTSIVPVPALLRYFGPRLITMQIDRNGSSVTYVAAQPRGVRGGVVPLTVTIRESSARDEEARVRVIEEPPAPMEGVVIPPERIEEHFRDLSEHRE